MNLYVVGKIQRKKIYSTYHRKSSIRNFRGVELLIFKYRIFDPIFSLLIIHDSHFKKSVKQRKN